MPACASDTHDGRSPDAGLTILNGVIYGTTPLGGMDVSRGQGTVFSLSTSGNQHAPQESYAQRRLRLRCLVGLDLPESYALRSVSLSTSELRSLEPRRSSVSTPGSHLLLHYFHNGINRSYPRRVLYNFKCKGSCNGRGPVALTVLKVCSTERQLTDQRTRIPERCLASRPRERSRCSTILIAEATELTPKR